MKRRIGLDAGSVSVKLAILDEAGNIIKTEYVRHRGNPHAVALELLRDAPRAPLSITGTAGGLIAEVLGIKPVNEVIALGYAIRRLYPHVKSVIEMGGEDSKLLIFEDGMVKEFSMNSVCAAGTGSFLDQQAERLLLSIEEFSQMALRSKNPPRIAGRCSVFAKSDMIHLQQIATPVEDIVAGLCFAVARNFKGSICRNMTLPEPILFIGGVAANKGVERAFREVLETDRIEVPEHFTSLPAIGAALKDMEEGVESDFEIKRLEEFIASPREETGVCRPLCDDMDEFRKRHTVSYHIHRPSGGRVRAFLGIDVGSISTNLAVIDEEGRLLAKRYLMTSGRPIEAVRKGLEEIGNEIGDVVEIAGVGTTGSGRYMIADFVGADIVKNEITAQARAAIEIDPEVDTIFEIGGQDSKYISLRDGVILDFEMNKACAAGTGSFLEEQAEKLDISIKGEFSELAFRSKSPCPLGERCTVFMETSLLAKRQKGASKEDLVAGLAYSIVQNYINRVVNGKPIGRRIFFQGGTAFNKAIVAAFERYLGRRITVPPHHDVTGAIGMALIAREYMRGGNALCIMRNEPSGGHASGGKGTTHHTPRITKFKGFDLSRRGYEIRSFECNGCDNHCEINRVKIEGEEGALYYGSRCERYDVKKKAVRRRMPDLFEERERLLTKVHNAYKERQGSNGSGNRVQIGIPRIFFFHDFLPFWSTLLWELGFEVVLSSRTNRQVINRGIESILSESCFPHKVAHGHIRDLIDRGIKNILLPSFINFNTVEKGMRGFACPYAQTMPYIANVAFEGINIIRPVVNLESGIKGLLKEIKRVLRPFGISSSSIKRAVEKAEGAQAEFVASIKARGREVLQSLSDRAIVIIGRSYNAFDPGVNLDIPRKLSSLGVLSIPMDFLPIEDIDILSLWPNMYWRSGQNILSAAEIIRDDPRLFGLYIGNFSCGPDSFILKYFNDSMSGKPFLHIEIDEHSADAGVITRCEAFLDSISGRPSITTGSPRRPSITGVKRESVRRKVYIPRMSDHAFALKAAFEACGLDAEVMEPPDAESVALGRRYVSGKECYPCAVTTGDMLRKALSKDFDPERSAFFMPSGTGPCRFGQYNVLHRLILDEIGLPQVPVIAPNQDSSFFRELGIIGNDFTRQAWKGIVSIELLIKCLHETRPYEVNRGETEGLYREYLGRIEGAIRSRNGDIPRILTEMQRDFASIKRRQEERPLIGIIGEIFVRHNAFSNEDVVRKVEALGGEVWLAPVEEWIYYVNLMALRKSLVRFRNSPSRDAMSDILTTLITRYMQSKIEHEYSRPFKGFLKTLKEPSTKEILKNASPYLDDSFEGEAILSIGKAVDFIKAGVSGIISVMPFGCMPGTIVGALMKGLKRDTGIPCLNIAYDGVEASCSGLQLEAFIHQAITYNKVRR
jgi:predicted CoA-substrate-specific enzyme activase